jgi:hypothetical protein
VAGSRNPRERARTKKGEISPALLIQEQKERARLNIQRQERAREAARRREAIHHGEYLSKRVARCLEAGEQAGGIIGRRTVPTLPVSKILHLSFREFLYSEGG